MTGTRVDFSLALPLILGAVVYLVLAFTIARNRSTPGATAMVAVMLCVAVWLTGAAFELESASVASFLLSSKLKYVGVAVLPVAFLVFFLQFTGRLEVRWPLVVTLLAVPVATIVLTWTNEWHGAMWAHPPVGPDGEIRIRLDWGWWFRWVHTPYSYGLLLVGVLALLGEMFSASKLYRSQVAVLLTATLIPLAANVLFLAGLGSGELSFTPLAFAISGLIFSWGLFRFRLFQLNPVAYQAVFDTMKDGVIVLDHENRIVDLNPIAEYVTGSTEAEVLGRPIGEVLPPGSTLAGLVERGAESKGVHATDAGESWEVEVAPVVARSGEVRGRMAFLRDVTERWRTEAALRESEQVVRSIVEHSPNGILRLRPVRSADDALTDFTCIFANQAASVFLGTELERLVGASLRSVRPKEFGTLLGAFGEVIETGQACDLEIPGGFGEGRWFRVIGVPVGGDISATFVDISGGKRREREIRAAALQDPLTGLLNRRGLEAELIPVLEGARATDQKCAVLYLDLDRFKEVNDSYGHESGDALLIELARRIQRSVRSIDVVARLGGDEFVLGLPDVELQTAEEIAGRILAETRRPYEILGATIECPASIGIAIHPNQGDGLVQLIREADQAMYRAKAAGGGIRGSGVARS